MARRSFITYSENEADHITRYCCYYDQAVDITMLQAIQICGDEIQFAMQSRVHVCALLLIIVKIVITPGKIITIGILFGVTLFGII